MHARVPGSCWTTCGLLLLFGNGCATPSLPDGMPVGEDGGTEEPVCADPCPRLGQRDCYGPGYRVCRPVDEPPGCLSWVFQPCRTDETCREGVCQPEECADECAAAGLTECDGPAARRTCEDADEDGCLTWGPAEPCPANESCELGACRPACTDQCPTAGLTECVEGLGVRTCADADEDGCREWSAPVACAADETCFEGRCHACLDECQPGELRCVGDERSRCGLFDEDPCLDWGPADPCPDGKICRNDACVQACADDCEEGAQRCTEGRLQRCEGVTPEGCRTWGAAQACPARQQCDAATGRCEEPPCLHECDAGDRRCEPNGRGAQTCGDPDEDGCREWNLPDPCVPGTRCEAGACVVVCQDECPALGERTCAGEQRFRECGDPDGDGCRSWSAEVACGERERCEDGQCRPWCEDECPVLGQVACNEGDSAVRRCGDQDADPCLEWSAAEPCPPGQTCQAGQCTARCTDDCALGELGCQNHGVVTCGQYDDDDCLDWSAPTPCQAWEECNGGSCRVACADDCLEGLLRCTDASHFQQCGQADADPCREWAATQPCPAGEACHQGACLAAAPGPVIISEVRYDDPGNDGEDSFLELYGPGELSLDHFRIEGVNGANGEIYLTLGLDGERIPADGYFVIASTLAQGAVRTAADRLVEGFDLQNGADSVRLVWGAATVVDALGYGFQPGARFYAGEGASAIDVPDTRGLTRDADGTDSDHNAHDFQPEPVPTPGGPDVSDWARTWIAGPGDATPMPLAPELALTPAGDLMAGFLSENEEILWLALGDLQGDWLLQEIELPSSYQELSLTWRGPLGLHPGGELAAAVVGSVLVDELRGVQIGYVTASGPAGHVESVRELAARDYQSPAGSWIATPTGTRLALDDDGETPLVAYMIARANAQPNTLELSRRDGPGVWSVSVAADDIRGRFDLVRIGGELHVVYAASSPDGLVALHHRVRQGGAWSQPAVVQDGLTQLEDLRVFADGRGELHACYLDTLRLELDPHGQLVSGQGRLECASFRNGAWRVSVVQAASDDRLPRALGATMGPEGLLVAAHDFWTGGLWLHSQSAAGAWSRELVDFGGLTGLTPTLVLDQAGGYHLLHTTQSLRQRGLLHHRR